MKKINQYLSIALCICLAVCALSTFVSAQEISSQNEEVCQLLTEICSDPNATMLDFIRVANPEFYASITNEQRVAFENMSYQAALNGAYASNTARAFSGYVLQADISFHALRPIMY